jgi:hypothetical protein
LGQCFECAKHTHEHLLAIQKHWTQRRRDAKVDGGSGSKRKNQSELSSSIAGVKQKRSRPLQETEVANA